MLFNKFTFLAAVIALAAAACATKSGDHSALIPTAHKHPGIIQIAYEFKEPGGAVNFAREDEFVFCGDCGEPAMPEPALKADLKLGVPSVMAEGPADSSHIPAGEAKPETILAADNPPTQKVEQSPASAPASPARAAPKCSDGKNAPICGELTPVTVFFGFNSAALTGDKVSLEHLRKNLVYRVTGYTDDQGSLKANAKVALARANTVAEFLKVQGYKVEERVGRPKCCYPDVKILFNPGQFEAYPKNIQTELLGFHSRRAEIEVIKSSPAEPQPVSMLGVPSSFQITFMAERLLTGASEKGKNSKNDLKNAENLFKLSWGKNVSSYRSFSQSPIEGLYEVIAEGPNGFQIFYFGPPDKLLIGANVLTTKGENLTEAKLAGLEEEKAAIEAKNAPPLSSFPIGDSITIGNGNRTVIEVSDPDCPFCRRAEDYFAGKEQLVTRHIFLTALPMHKEAPAKVKYILCSADRTAAYREVASGKFDGKPMEIPPECESAVKTALARHEEVVQKLNARGTPLFFIPAQSGTVPRKISGLNEAQLNKSINGGK